MFLGEENSFDEDYGVNPYESFMRRHLQHYGYYTGKNQNYKNQFQQYAEWEKNYGYNLHGSSSEMDSDSDDEEDKHGESKLQDDPRTTQLIYSYGESGKMVPRLREPRSLYALNKELGPQQAARWPSNLQVLDERIHHLQKVPSEPEPFYKTTGYEKCPMVRGEANGGRPVFNYETNASFFMKSRVGGSRNGCEQCSVTLESEEDTTLIFESRFESGNLGKAIQIGEFDYELWLRYDLYTNKHTQWFYFRVSNTRANKPYRFTIVNFMKPDSLYNNGMRPLIYSETEAAKNKVGWVRGGHDIKYYKNNMTYEMSKTDRNFYSLSFTAEFQHDNDTVYFSHCYPYTYTDLQDYLLELTNDPIKSRICKQRVLCRTLAGNLVYVLTITSASQNPEDIKHKKAVVVTARVHPGESNSSWMMKGFLDFVTGSSPDAKLLRDTFIFKVVPMLNPDGVIVGNYRCSLAGRDLNRNYKTTLKDAYPSVWHTKTMIRKLLQERDIIVYCDLHGHSRRQNVFIYGCEQRHGSNKRFHERIFPSMLNKNSPDKFCFHSCKFKVQKSKEGTGRIVMWNMGIMNSYTMEATFCGSSLGKKKGFHFNQNDYEMMGYHFCDTLLDYCDPDNTKYAKILVDVEHRHQMEIMTKIAEKGLEPENVEVMSDVSSDTESSDGGSDSSVSDGPPVHLQYAAARPKKKRLKSKRDRDKVRGPVKEEHIVKKVPALHEDKRTRNNQIRPLKPEFTKNQAIRYTSTSPRRPRSHDDRANSGIPVFVQERFDEKNQKRHDYLEALTAAYISNNIPLVNDPDVNSRPSTTPPQGRALPTATAEIWAGCQHALEPQKSVVHFRYSGSSSDRPPHPQGQAMDGLCAHHEQVMSAHYAATQANSGVYSESDEFYAALRDLQLRKLTPKWLHEEAAKMYPLVHVRRGDSAFKISRLVGRKEARNSDNNMDDLFKSQLTHSASINPLDRRHKPHLLEVSAAQQRQTDALSKDKNGPIKTHPNPFDEKCESGLKSDRSLPGTAKKTPSETTYVNYNTFHIAQVKDPRASETEKMNTKEDEQKGHGKHKERSGRKSRKGMREEDERGEIDSDLGQNSGTVFDVKGKLLAPQIPQIKSAQSSSDMTNAVSSIQELQKSLQPPHLYGKTDDKEMHVNQSNGNAAGEYIEKLIKQTNDEIEGLTNEIQDDIEKKHYTHLISKDRPARFFAHKSKDYHQTKSTPVSDYSSKVPEQRGLFKIGVHGGTFVVDMEASREKGGYLGGKSVVASSSTPQIAARTHAPLPKSGEYLSYSGSSNNKATHSPGLNLLVSNDKPSKDTKMEEEVVLHKHKKQNSLSSGSGVKSGATLSHTSIGGHVTSQLLVSQPNLHGHEIRKHSITSLTSSEHACQEDGQNYQAGSIRSVSSSQGIHSQSNSSVKLNKQNLVFRTPNAESGRTGTPKEQSQGVDQHDYRGQESGDGSESHTRSARSGSRQVVEAVPTKISLMICNDHQEASPVSGQFLPLSRQGRPSRQGRRK